MNPKGSFEVYGIHIGPAVTSQYFADHGKENAPTLSALANSWLSLLASTPSGTSSKPKKIVNQFFYGDLSSSKILATIKRFSQLGDKVFESGHLTENGTKVLFIREMQSTPIFREYLHWYRTGDHKYLRWILSFLNWGKKAKVRYPEFDETSLRGWLSVEERLRSLSLPVWIKNLRVIVDFILQRPASISVKPHFGPGAVSEQGVVGAVMKADNLNYSHRVALMFHNSRFGLASWPEGDGIDFMASYAVKDRKHPNSRKFSRLKFVAKNYKTSRSISAEPNIIMFGQQAVRHVLEKAMKQSPIHKFVDLGDQTRSRLIAQYGSLTNMVDTIDLSSASDSVSWELVKRIFPKWALFLLGMTRTNKVMLPDGSIVPVRKFAPMGSAVCFPTQCIIYTAVCIYAHLLHLHGTGDGEGLLVTFDMVEAVCNNIRASHTEYETGYFAPLVVYGDDIICDHRVTDKVIHLLTMLGFMVNVTKSFIGQSVARESCGGYYWEGHDVTFLTFQVRDLNGKGENAASVSGMVQLCNRAREYGFLPLRSYLIHVLRSIPGIPFRPASPVPEDYDPSIPSEAWTKQVLIESSGWPSLSIATTKTRGINDHLDRNSNPVAPPRPDYGLPRLRIRCLVPRRESPREPSLNWRLERYLLSWTTGSPSDNDSLVSVGGGELSRVRVEETRLGWGWTPDRAS